MRASKIDGIQDIFLTFVHQQATLLCFLLVAQVVGEQHHPETVLVTIRRLQVLHVPLCGNADGAVVTVVGALPGFTLDERLPSCMEIK